MHKVLIEHSMQQPLFFYAHSISSFTWTLSLTSSSTSGNFDFWQFRFLTALLAIVCSPGVSLAFHYAREGRIAQEARLSAVAGLYERPERRRGLLSAPGSLMAFLSSRGQARAQNRTSITADMRLSSFCTQPCPHFGRASARFRNAIRRS